MNNTTSPIAIATGDKFRLSFGATHYSVIAVNETQIVVKGDVNGLFFIVDRTTLKDQDGDKWERVEPETVYYRNVYLDGLGDTQHTTENAARYGTKYGGTRIGIQKITERGGKIVGAEVIPTEPTVRSRYAGAHNPFA